MSTHYPVAIIGAGLGGLMTAVVLRRSGVEAPIFELDMSAVPDEKNIGDIGDDPVHRAVRIAGLYELVSKKDLPAIEDRESERGVVLYSDQELAPDRRNFEQGALRGVLLAALAADTVRWGSKVTHIEQLATDMHLVRLADGTEFTAATLIGAEGAWSKTQGANGEESSQTESFDGLRLKDLMELQTESSAFFEQNSVFVLEDAEPAQGPRAVYTLPVGEHWQHVLGLTVIGDPENLATPFENRSTGIALIAAPAAKVSREG